MKPESPEGKHRKIVPESYDNKPAIPRVLSSTAVGCKRTSYFHPKSTPSTQPVPQHQQPNRWIDAYTVGFGETVDEVIQAMQFRAV